MTMSASTREPTMVHCPLVYGSIAFWLGRKADELHTHRWTLFVRGPRHEDLSYFISKVVFVLHPSFAEPIREVTEPPYEVTEMGWGEFEATVRIFFRDAAQKAVEFTHVIKLYPASNHQLSKLPVVHEFYDEVTFVDPAPALLERVRAASRALIEGHPLEEHFLPIDDAEDVQLLVGAEEHVQKQIQDIKDQITRVDGEINMHLARQQQHLQQQQQQQQQLQQQQQQT